MSSVLCAVNGARLAENLRDAESSRRSGAIVIIGGGYFHHLATTAMHATLTIETPGQGLHEITVDVRNALEQLLERDTSASASGLCTLFLQHTSASLTIQENADPSARRDLEAWMNRLVPERDALYTHTSEGPDDMPSHIKSALTATTLSIPIIDGSLALGTWQGIYLWEHRTRAHRRRLVIHAG